MRLRRAAIFAGILLLGGCGQAPSRPAAPPAAVPVAAPPSSPPIRIRVTGGNWKWEVRYPGEDGILDSDDDVVDEQNVHLPAGSHVTLDLDSRDYSYSFYVPDYDLIEVALPGSPFRREFDSGAAGVHKLLGSQMCGYAHPDLLGDVVVQEPADFDAWIKKSSSAPKLPASASDPAS